MDGCVFQYWVLLFEINVLNRSKEIIQHRRAWSDFFQALQFIALPQGRTFLNPLRKPSS